jgi:hypothetical protein
MEEDGSVVFANLLTLLDVLDGLHDHRVLHVVPGANVMIMEILNIKLAFLNPGMYSDPQPETATMLIAL